MTAENNTPLNDYLGPVLAYKKLIAVVAIGTIMLGVAAGFAVPTSYSATTSLLVYPISADPTKALGSDDSSIDMPTELRIATSQAVIDSASARLAGTPEQIGPRTLADSVTASSPKESSILDITVDASTAVKAKAGADAVADSYLDFRAELANTNKLAAQTSMNSRLAILNERLAEIETRYQQARTGSTEKVILAVERNSVQSEVGAQQAALADLSTLTIDSTKVIDIAVQPDAPTGLGLVQIVIGSIAGGLVLGVIAAYAAAALKASGAGSSGPAGTRNAPAELPVVGSQPAGEVVTVTATVSQPVAQSVDQADDQAETARTAVARFEQATEAEAAAEGAADQPVADAESETSTVETGTSETETDAAEAQTTIDAEGETQTEAEAEANDASIGEADTQTDTDTAEIPTLATVSDRDDERRDTYTVRPATEERRALHIDDNGQSALTATPDMDGLLEYLQELGKVGPIVGLTLGEEGVGTSIAVAFDLADALQSLGAKVLMIDACHDDPLLASLLSVDASPGLSEVLTGKATLRSAVRQVGGLKGLDALTVGEVTDSTVSDITGSPFERLLAEAKVDYHSILIISGAVSDTTTVPTLASLSDGLIVGTTQPPGGQAGAELCRQLAALPAPTLEFLSEMLVVERSDGAVVVGAASM